MPRKIVFQHLRKTGGTTIRDMLWAFVPPERRADWQGESGIPRTIDEAAQWWSDCDFAHDHRELLTTAAAGAFKFSFFRDPFARLLSDRRQWMQASPADIALMPANRAQATARLQGLTLRDIIARMEEFPIMMSSLWNYQAVTLGAWPLVRAWSRRRSFDDYLNFNFYLHFGSGREALAWLHANEAAIMRQARQSLAALDYVGLTETFDQSACEVFARIGLPEPGAVPVRNARKPFADEADPGLRDFAAPLLRLDYELYEAARERHARFDRIARGSPADYVGRRLDAGMTARFGAEEAPGGHGWHVAHRRTDGSHSRWTDGTGRSHFSLRSPSGRFEVAVSFFGAVSEESILTLRLEIDGVALATAVSCEAEGWVARAVFEREEHGRFDIVLAVPAAAGDHGVEVRQWSFRSLA